MVEETNRDINVFANKGLRTLAVAYRLVPDEEYDKLAQSKSYAKFTYKKTLS